jgi:hypothetical protein
MTPEARRAALDRTGEGGCPHMSISLGRCIFDVRFRMALSAKQGRTFSHDRMYFWTLDRNPRRA